MKIRVMKVRGVLAAAPLLGLLGVLAGGCAPSQSAGKVVSSSDADLAAADKKEIERIKNDPRMPPQAKAAAIKARERAMLAARTTQGGRQ